MRFDELASKAGKAAANVGRRAERPPFARVLDRHRSRVLIAGWSTAAVAVMAILGVVLLWPGPGSELPPAAVDTTQTTIMSESTTLAERVEPGVIEGGREACPITAPGDSPFTPESEVPDASPPSVEAVWFGTPELWTFVQSQGQDWTGLPVGADGSLTQKTFWWSDDFVISEELDPDITVTGERLDGSALTVKAGGPGTHGTNPEQGSFMIVGLEIPEEGCWRITAEYRDTTLSYVVWVDGSSPEARSDLDEVVGMAHT